MHIPEDGSIHQDATSGGMHIPEDGSIHQDATSEGMHIPEDGSIHQDAATSRRKRDGPAEIRTQDLRHVKATS
jgi:hypothetical protein